MNIWLTGSAWTLLGLALVIAILPIRIVIRLVAQQIAQVIEKEFMNKAIFRVIKKIILTLIAVIIFFEVFVYMNDNHWGAIWYGVLCIVCAKTLSEITGLKPNNKSIFEKNSKPK